MPENARLNGNIDQIESKFVKREVTPRFLIKLNI